MGYGRKRSALRDVIIALDSSGSMATSVVYGSIYASVMASIPALATKLVMFDTSVVDLTDQLDDPVELIFGLKLAGWRHKY
ncbi:Mg-chelatase subunit ChlD [hydrothermal vent metagenome]|uniref:Mg-chelatase subunit ChlD n=1 Tax=hydrothermal vent metagenome TaxID=652676 RepID=A0A3B0UYS5_9ZZZZ